MVNHIVYLHGFNSSPLSTKAQQFKNILTSDYPQVQVHIPQLATWPAQAMQEVAELVETLSGKVAFVGSSLGGFYATWLAHKFAAKAVLINPAVQPDVLLQSLLGPQRNYHTDDGEYLLTHEHMDQLRALTLVQVETPEHLLVLLQTADETLDYQLAAQYYKGCQLDIEQGGSHAYDNFPQRIPQIMAFVG